MNPALIAELQTIKRLLLAEGRPMLAHVVQDATDELHELHETIIKLHDGRLAVLPKTAKHARVLILVAEACLKNITQ